MADRILLRTLTFKSKLGFEGALEDLTVEDAIKLDYQIRLIEAYFNFSKINFTSEVLDKLNISKEDRISKPGKDEERGEKILKVLRIERVKEKRKLKEKLALEGKKDHVFDKFKKRRSQYVAAARLN